ncbi:MAG: AAA family ATPase [Clostridia bacterium]|nr:AAA family ATPase [Clostridia bacterium]
MIKTRVTFDIEDHEYFSMLKTYISLNYSEVIITDDCNFDFIITDKPLEGDQYIIISSHHFTIYKYQKASKICSQIVNCAAKEVADDEYEISGKKAKLIVVTSAAGGAGKTRLSQSLCIRLAEMKQKVLYMSLDCFSAMEGKFNDDNENDISKLQYYLTLKRDTNKSVEAIKGYDSIHNVYFIRSIYPSMDQLFDLDTMETLLTGLMKNTVYQYIIFDIPTCITEASLLLMNHAFLTFVINKFDSPREKIYLKFLTDRTGKNMKAVPSDYDLEQMIGMMSGIEYE